MAAGLLLADFVCRHAPEKMSHGTGGPLLAGDVLIITHSVGDTIEWLNTIQFKDYRLRDHWHVGSFSKFSRSHGPARVFAANPGWVLEESLDRRISALLIDATHPRTLTKVPRLLDKIGKMPLQILVTCPLPKFELAKISNQQTGIWLWHPEAKSAVEEVITGMKPVSIPPVTRTLHICDDPVMDETLSEVHNLLSFCMSMQDRPMPAVWEAWSLLQRFRQLAVPLPQVEDITHQVWGALSFSKRLERLKNEWPETAAVEFRWPKILDGLHKIYDHLQGHKEPDKFWAVAESVQDHLSEREALRIVAPTDYEATILALNLTPWVDGWLEAQESRVEIISAKEEARRVSAGECKHTFLLGARTGFFKYLDIYPSCPVDIAVYPYEANQDRNQQERYYDFLELLQSEEERTNILKKLEMPLTPKDDRKCISCRPILHCDKEAESRLRKADIVTLEPEMFNIDHLAESGVSASWNEDPPPGHEAKGGFWQKREKNVHVTFIGGLAVDYARDQMIDVYHHSVGGIQRYPAFELKPGMRVAMLVDGMYESLYERLLEALREKVCLNDRMLLSLWDQAKLKVLRHYKTKRDLHRHLVGKGISIDYATMRLWFRDEPSPEQLAFDFHDPRSKDAETIAPRDYKNMKILADESGVYSNEGLIKATYKMIQHERGRRRKAGIALHDLLRAIAAGEGYENALTGARKLGSSVADVLNAVELKEIKTVTIMSGEKEIHG